jgi:hypothetical protein
MQTVEVVAAVGNTSVVGGVAGGRKPSAIVLLRWLGGPSSTSVAVRSRSFRAPRHGSTRLNSLRCPPPTGPPSKAMNAQQADDVITKTAAVWRALLSRPLSSINSLSKSPAPLFTRVLAVPKSRPAGPAYSPGDRAVESPAVAT